MKNEGRPILCWLCMYCGRENLGRWTSCHGCSQVREKVLQNYFPLWPLPKFGVEEEFRILHSIQKGIVNCKRELACEANPRIQETLEHLERALASHLGISSDRPHWSLS